MRCLPRRAFTWLVLLDWFRPFRPVFLAVLFSFFLPSPASNNLFVYTLPPPFTLRFGHFLPTIGIDASPLPPPHAFLPGWLPLNIPFPAKGGVAIEHRHLHDIVLQLLARHHSSSASLLSRRFYFEPTFIGTTATDLPTVFFTYSCIINVI